MERPGSHHRSLPASGMRAQGLGSACQTHPHWTLHRELGGHWFSLTGVAGDGGHWTVLPGSPLRKRTYPSPGSERTASR